jgi:quaternary ammonium compound-resistance protein SugE
MHWGALLIAGLLECGWAIGLKYSDGFTRPWPSIMTVIAMAISLGLLSFALKGIPISAAYAVWTGIGAIGVAVLGMTLLGEPAGIAKIVFLTMILIGIIGLRLTSDT